MENKLYSASTQMTPNIYKDFYKVYYKERLRIFNTVSTVIAVILILIGAYIYYSEMPLVWCVIALWIGAFLLFYPHVAYKKPYKRDKDKTQTTHFAFYENYVAEKTNSKSSDYNYSDLEKIIETNKYFLIFHSMESVSIVDKEHMSAPSEEIAAFLKTKTEYKRLK
ncbi:MAG: YcxB family protein [Oscillospiraceae bacterium]|nr:YcxB family protein [Oscillospiraceae bacterium]